MKRDLLSKIIAFAAGAGIGSAVTYKALKTKYDQLIQEEIDSIKEAFSRVDSEGSNNPTEESVEEDEPDEEDTEDDIEAAEEVINQNGYATVSDNKVEEEEDDDMDEPHVISPDEFGDCDYVTVTLWYYTDGVVTNDDGKMISNVEELIGKDFADHFGEYEEDPDTVYVRNDDQEIDYQVLAEYRAYSER